MVGHGCCQGDSTRGSAPPHSTPAHRTAAYGAPGDGTAGKAVSGPTGHAARRSDREALTGDFPSADRFTRRPGGSGLGGAYGWMGKVMW
eukprot:1162147-Pelagomonas_calceolata.AAC.6